MRGFEKEDMTQSPDIGFVYDQLRKVDPNQIKRFRLLVPHAPEGFPWSEPFMDGEGNLVPYSCGPHSIGGFDVWRRLEQPLHVLEIGFNRGFSAAIMLGIHIEKVTSCEARRSDQVSNDAKAVSDAYPHRFQLINEPSGSFVIPASCDAAFIDGQHDFDSIVRDIQFCRQSGKIRTFLFDDIFPIHGDTMEAIKECGLIVHCIVGNFCIARDIDTRTWVSV